MQITFDKASSKFVYQLLEPSIKNKTCPFCEQKVTPSKFAGAFHFEGEPRMVDRSLPCLLGLGMLIMAED